MTTDITELARRVEHIISDMKLKHGDKDTYAPVMKWDEFLALVEALEHYKSREERVTSLVRNNSKSWDELYRQVEAKGKRNVELVEALEKAQTKADVYDMLRDGYGLREKGVGLADFVDWQAKRIAELESRAVKIVDCDFDAVQHMSGGSTDYCHGFVDGTQNAIRSITAAGIKVEAE